MEWRSIRGCPQTLQHRYAADKAKHAMHGQHDIDGQRAVVSDFLLLDSDVEHTEAECDVWI